MEYYKVIDGKLVKAPKNLKRDDGSVIINYNLNVDQLIKDGYRTMSNEEIQFFYNEQNNNEPEIDSIENKSFSKLKVKEKLVELGIWETLKSSLTETEYEDLLLAKDLAFDNQTFVKFYNQLKEQIPNIDMILKECID